MATALVSLAQKLVDPIIQEALLLFSVEDVDASASTRCGSAAAHNMVLEVREVAFEAEDAIDEFVYKIETTRRSDILGKAKNCISLRRGARLHFIGTKVISVHDTIVEISTALGLAASTGGGDVARQPQVVLKVALADEEVRDVVNLTFDVEVLKKRLTEKEYEMLRVISIIALQKLVNMRNMPRLENNVFNTQKNQG